MRKSNIEKEIARLLIMDDIKAGNFTSLYEKAYKILPFSTKEIQAIIKAWRKAGFEDLLFFYYIGIFMNDPKVITKSDEYYLEYLKNNDETVKRG